MWGDDGGPTAFGVMPFVKLPTADDGLGNDEVEGGVIFPFACDLVAGFGLGAQVEVDVVADDEGGGHHLETFFTLTVGRDLAWGLAFYVELTALVSAERGPWVGTFDAGLTWGLTDDVQLDLGVNVGITRSAPDYEPFLGLTVRY